MSVPTGKESQLVLYFEGQNLTSRYVNYEDRTLGSLRDDNSSNKVRYDAREMRFYLMINGKNLRELTGDHLTMKQLGVRGPTDQSISVEVSLLETSVICLVNSAAR